MQMQKSWLEELNRGAQQMEFELTEDQAEILVNYLALLCKWNKTFNLTAIRNESEMVSRQLLDSLSILPFIQGETVLDIGTGPGLPGIPLSVLLPNKTFTLLDSNGKKTRFVRQCMTELELPNVEVINDRVESLQIDEGYHTITSRAFSSLPDFVAVAVGLLHQNGRMVAMKGTLPEQEMAQLNQQGYVTEGHVLQVPGTAGQRHVVTVLPPYR